MNFHLLPSLFKEGGNISFIVNGRRQYSSDLPQGGLEVPCCLIFEGNKKDIDKINITKA